MKGGKQMTRLEHLLQPLYREGKISTGEMIALFGAVRTIKEAEAKDNIRWSEFKSEYGTIGAEGINQLEMEVI